MKIVAEFWMIWSPLPKGGRWTKQTYTQRVYILLLTDDEEGTDQRHLVAEDLLPAGRTKKKMLADQNEFYVDVIAESRKSHPSTPKRPTSLMTRRSGDEHGRTVGYSVIQEPFR